MKRRCSEPKHVGWALYGGRGIRVCPEWMASFDAFYAHIGPKPSPRHSVDRIDNSRGYEPGNVRWATPKEQSRNRRPSFLLIRQRIERLEAQLRELGVEPRQ